MPLLPVAAVPEPAVPEPVVAPVVGPATQELIDKKAAKTAILKETAEKLKAVDAPAPAAKPKPRAKAVAVAEGAAPVAPKPRAPRKTKKADEA